MSKLEDYRKEIDLIDKELVSLFERRMDLAVKVGEYKKENNLPILNEAREKEVIKKNISKLKNINYSNITEEFFEKIMELSRSLQKNIVKEEADESSINKEEMVIGYQGLEGAFSEEAVLKFFNNPKNTKKYEHFEDVFEAIAKKEINYGVLPIENSYTGAISEVYDLLVKYGFYIIGEECVKIDQHLIGIKGAALEEIEEIYSHPQGFHQSKKFLSQFDKVKLIPYYNTAISAKYVADLKDKRKAAIGSRRAAEIYGLEILKEKINDKRDNCTKFIVISRNPNYDKKSDKISVVFSLEDKAGNLYSLLRYFAENNINMIKIESRPNKNESWKYLLYVDFEGNLENEDVRKALSRIEENSRYFRILGSYKSSLK